MSSRFTRCLSASILTASVIACGGKTFSDSGGTGGDAGSMDGGSGGKGAGGGSGGSSGATTGGRGGSGGGTGGSSASGGSGGGTGGSSASGGSGGRAGSGSGGDAGGSTGGSGGSVSGGGGDAGSSAGVAGSSAGAGGCGPCPGGGGACLPPFMVTVSAENGSNIADLKANASFPISCYPNGAAPCQWTCQSDYQLGAGDYSVVLAAPGFEAKTIDFTIDPQTNCGCCGCGCAIGYSGAEQLAGTGGEACCADRHVDPMNCGACGNACGSGVCNAGKCEGGTDCATITTRDECDASSDCHSVFVDPGTCGCGAPGCCAHFSRCADGDHADCTGANVACEAATPYCDDPTYVVSYSGSCYEGCVDPKDCAP